MKQTLIKDVLVVFGFWFVVLYLVSGAPISWVPYVAEGVFLIWIVGLGLGAAAAWCLSFGSLAKKRDQMGTDDADGEAEATVMDGTDEHTLYAVRLPKAGPVSMAEAGVVERNPLHQEPWWREYAKRCRAFASVIDEVYRVMETKPGLSAGFNGGHGDETLVGHSLRVWHKMLDAAPQWRFDGIKDHSGRVIVPLQGTSRANTSVWGGSVTASPILPLLAFAHDIGKVECFVADDSGKIVASLPGHGRRGGTVMRRLPAFSNLPKRDRDALTMALEYYHGLSGMPTGAWVGDRTRSLAALLHVADTLASQEEGYRTEDAAAAIATYLTDTPAAAVESEAMAECNTDASRGRRESAPRDSASTDGPSGVSERTVTAGPRGSLVGDAVPLAASTGNILSNGASVLDGFREVLRGKDRINGRNRERRAAFKYGDWLFVLVQPFGEALEKFGNTEFDERVRTAMLKAIDAEDGLLRTVGSVTKPAAEAIWQAATSDLGDLTQAPLREVFAVQARMVPGAEKIRDCKRCPGLYVDNSFHSFAPSETEAGSTRVKSQVVTGEERIPVTASWLRSLAVATEPSHGRRLLEPGGRKVAWFRADTFGDDYEFDLDALPDGVVKRRSKKDAIVYIGVLYESDTKDPE